MNAPKTIGIIILVLVLISVVLIAILGWPGSDTQENIDLSTQPVNEQPGDTTTDIRTADPLSTEETVIYNGETFSPTRLEISEGTTVTWVNESNRALWVASGVHPTHELLPSFDAQQAIGRGETYSYTFDLLGEWPYHNHAEPSHTGVIFVLPLK